MSSKKSSKKKEETKVDERLKMVNDQSILFQKVKGSWPMDELPIKKEKKPSVLQYNKYTCVNRYAAFICP